MLDIIDGSCLWSSTTLRRGVYFLERVYAIDANPRVLAVGVNSVVWGDGNYAMVNTFTKDPGAKLDYRFDWASKTNGTGTSDWLQPNETIASITVTVTTGLTLVSSALVSGSTACVVWVSGGTDNTDYSIVCHIVTSATREDDRTITIKVRNV